MSRYTPLARVAASLAFAALASARAQALAADADARCSAVTLRSGDLDGAWRAAVEETRAQIAQLSSSECPTVALSLVQRHGAVVLRAAAPDGRVAEREVRAPSALAAIALGLLAAIPAEPVAAVSAAPPPAPRPPDPSDLPPRDASPPPGHVADPTVQLAVGAAAGARIGEPTRVLMGDLEARADLVAAGWIVVASARFVVVGARPSSAPIAGYSYNEYAFGLGFGRRLAIASTTLDVAILPTLVLMDEEGGPSGVPGDTASGGDSYLRLGATARWNFARAGRWRYGLTLDGDFAPSDVRAARRFDVPLPPLPTWTTGLRLGAAGDVL